MAESTRSNIAYELLNLLQNIQYSWEIYLPNLKETIAYLIR